MNLSALLVDDERLARKRLRELLARHPEIQIVGEADTEDTALAAVESLRPDVLFLDMELSPGHGLDLLPRLPFQPATVFVTAHEAFAVQAFAVCAFDYLLKPVHPERLAQTVHRLLQGAQLAPLAPSPLTSEPATASPRDRIVLKDGATVVVTEVERIAAIQAVGAYTKVLLRNAAPMIVLRSISEWERLLPTPVFTRLDRSLIVHVPLVRQIEIISRDECQVTLDGLAGKLILGRAASARLKSCVADDNVPNRRAAAWES